MKIATWNVNSLGIRLRHVLDFLHEVEPDVLALQETKLTDDKFPREAIERAGYQAVYAGQKTYNGVALLSRETAGDVIFDLGRLEETDRRIIGATVQGVRILNLYVVNGQSVGSEKYAYKLRWLDCVTDHVKRELARHPALVVLGDFNITPSDEDVHDPQAWREQILCSTLEREALRRMLEAGLTDAFRLFDQSGVVYSWWDYRAGAFRRNRGLRIDLILVSEHLRARCERCYIDPAPRKKERPSDHTPVIAEFA